MKTYKFKNIAKILLIGMVQAAIPEEQVFYEADKGLKLPSDVKTISVPLKESETFGNCTCDLTTNACDTYCCCDSQCSKSIINSWTLEGKCQNIQNNNTQKLDKCASDVTKKRLSDVQDGFKMFGKVSSLLMCSAKVGGVGDTVTFIDPITMPVNGPTAAEKTAYRKAFDNLANDSHGQAKADYKIKDNKSVVTDPKKALSEKNTAGYVPGEQIRGWTEIPTADPSKPLKMVKPNNRINFQTAGLYGECSDVGFLSFMNSQSAT